MDTLTEHTPSPADLDRMTLVARCFADALGFEAVGHDDDFFDLGGHSMLGAKVVAGLRAAGLPRITLRDLFDHPTPAGVCRLLGDSMGNDGAVASGITRRPPITRRDPNSDVTMSFAQEGFLMLNGMTGGDPDAYFNQRCAFLVRGPLDTAALSGSLQRIVDRHELLRSAQTADGWHVLGTCAASIDAVTASGTTPADRLSDALRVAGEESSRSFDLERPPLIRIVLIAIEPDLHGLVVVLHHIASDWVSLDIASRELSANYRELVGGETADLPELAVQYWDFATWQRELDATGLIEEQMSYWSTQLADAEMYMLPSAIDDDVEWDVHGRAHIVDIPAAHVEAVRAVAAAESATLFMTLLAATKLAIADVTGRRRVAVAAFVANRRDEEIQDLIGIFPNIQVLSTDLGDAGSFEEIVRRVRAVCMDAQQHGDVPFHSLLEVPSFARWMNRIDQHWVLFYTHENAPWTLDLPGTHVEDWAEGVQSNAYPPIAGTFDPATGGPYLQIGPVDMDITFAPAPTGYTCRISYNTSVFDPESIEAFGRAIAARVAAIATDPHRSGPVSRRELPLGVRG